MDLKKKYILRQENILLILLIIVFFTSKIIVSNSALDIHLHDTYFVISNIYMAVFFLPYLIFIYFSYRFIRRKNKSINVFISLFQIAGLSLFCLLLFLPLNFMDSIGKPTRYYDFNTWNSLKEFSFYNEWVMITIFIIVISQLLFFIYFLIFVFKRLTVK